MGEITSNGDYENRIIESASNNVSKSSSESDNTQIIENNNIIETLNNSNVEEPVILDTNCKSPKIDKAWCNVDSKNIIEGSRRNL